MKMASSQVEFASSSPFGCVLRDCNRRDHRFRESNSNPNPNSNDINDNAKTNSTFQENLKEIVRDHLTPCISISSSDQNCYESSNPNSNSCRPNSVNGSTNTNLMTRNGHQHHRNNNLHCTNQKCKKEDEETMLSHRQSRMLDRRGAHQAKEMISTIQRQNHEVELMAHSNSNSVSFGSSAVIKREASPVPSDTSSVDVSVSSLVQKWRGYTEAKQIQNRKEVNGNDQIQSTTSSVNNNNGNQTIENNYDASYDEERSGLHSNNNNNERQSLSSNNEFESIVDWESVQSDKNSINDQAFESRSSWISDGSESDRLRVVDMVRKWANSNPTRTSCGENDQEQQQQNQPSPVVTPLARLRVDRGGNKSAFGPPVLGSPRLIRGRQAIADLFTWLERDRQKEIEDLASRQAVTKFPQRGRIQSLLKLRFLHRRAAVREQRLSPQSQSRSTESSRTQHAAAISSLREKFNTASEIEFASSNTTKERTGIAPEQDSTSLSKAKETLNGIVPAKHDSTCSNAKGAASERKSLSLSAKVRLIGIGSENDSISNSKERLSTSFHDPEESNASGSRIEFEVASKGDCLKFKSRETSSITSEYNSARSNTVERSNSTSKHDFTSLNAEESCPDTTSEHDSASSSSSSSSFKGQPCTAGVQEFTLLSTLRERLRPASGSGSRNVQCCNSNSSNEKDEMPSSSSQHISKEICQLEPKIEVRPTSVQVKIMGVQRTTERVLHLTENQQESTAPSQIIDETVQNKDFHVAENLMQNAVLQEGTEDQGMVYEGGIINFGSAQMEDTTTSYNDWEDDDMIAEDQEATCQSFHGINLDWISEIARPRSYWEDRRQAWYQEIFDSCSTNEDIRRLIERRTVSGVLASDFRERMDRLMMSNAQRYVHNVEMDQHEDEDRSMGTFLRRQMQQSWSSTQEQHQVQEKSDSITAECLDVHEEQQEASEREGHIHCQEEDQVENVEEEDDIDEEEDMEQSQYNDDGDFYDGTPSPLQLPWRSYHNDHAGSEEDSDQAASIPFRRTSIVHSYDHDTHEGSSLKNGSISAYGHEESEEDSDQAASTPFHQTSIVHSYGHDTHEGSSLKNGSIAMGLIYDLKVNMEQIYREVSELRKSINNYMDMQMNLQHSIRKEVSAAINDSDLLGQEGMESNQKVSKKGRCCICCEKKVDSFLYRCGHMCTCFNCARELHSSSGKCPICRAQIMDVVRAYPHA